MAIGRLWRYFGSPSGVAILVVQLVIVILFIYLYTGYRSSARCISCHSDKVRMTELGYPQFVMTLEQVRRESGHPNAECRDCHLGNGLSDDPDTAHKGMLRPLMLDHNFELLPRKARPAQLLPSGDDRLWSMLPRLPDGSLDHDFGTILYSDRNPLTYGYDPRIAKKTCGRSSCHPNEVKQFSSSVMGSNLRQRSMRHWLDTHGPNNCGPSFADTPPSGMAEGHRFSSANTDLIRKQMNVEITRLQAEDRQKVCNVCHAGCLDCHYTPSRERGVHAMSRIPPAESCSGGGRGSFVCHAGTMERRRGDSYLGREFSEPSGLPEDVHVSKKMVCVDCHQTGPGGMGHIERKATCQDCHLEIEQAIAESVHKNVSCAACHVNILGGYQMTSWGPGLVMGRPSPFKKYSLYYGPQSPPIIIKDQKGIWRPMKIWPNSVGFIREPVEPRPGIAFRWPDGETRDAYALLGTFSIPGGNNLYLAWLQLDEVGHPLGKSRSCKSCHASRSQVSKAAWEFYDSQGAEPFKGRNRIVADENGLRIEGLTLLSEIIPMKGYKIEDFAPWLRLGDIWKTAGDFSIPEADADKYKQFEQRYAAAVKRLEAVERELKQREARGEDVKKLRRRWKAVRASVLHNPPPPDVLDILLRELRESAPYEASSECLK